MLDGSSNVTEFLRLGDGARVISAECAASEFQFFDKQPLYLEIDPSSGGECQDFIYENGVPLASDRLKEFFDAFGIDYLFYKRVILKISERGFEEPYWLALPPRIDCLNFEKSEIDEVVNAADEIVINSNRIGRYDIFKLLYVSNLEIILTEDLADALKAKNFIGLHIYPLN